MGNGSSKIDANRMPSYFVSRPSPSPSSAIILDQSLQNIIQGPAASYHSQIDHPSKPQHRREPQRGLGGRLPFSRFYEVFFDRLRELEKIEESGVCAYLEHSLEQQSLFLVALLKNVVASPKSTLLAKKNGKWKRRDLKELRSFVDRYCGIRIESFGPIGEALLFSVEQCDEMYTEIPQRYWMEAYSLFLRQVINLVIKRSPRKSRTKFDFRKPVDSVVDSAIPLSSCGRHMNHMHGRRLTTITPPRQQPPLFCRSDISVVLPSKTDIPRSPLSTPSTSSRSPPSTSRSAPTITISTETTETETVNLLRISRSSTSYSSLSRSRDDSQIGTFDKPKFHKRQRSKSIDMSSEVRHMNIPTAVLMDSVLRKTIKSLKKPHSRSMTQTVFAPQLKTSATKSKQNRSNSNPNEQTEQCEKDCNLFGRGIDDAVDQKQQEQDRDSSCQNSNYLESQTSTQSRKISI